MVLEDIVKEELQFSSVFRDESRLSIDYIPIELPHRETKIRKLTRIFKEIVEHPGGSSKKVLITGASGTGKTATAMRFGQLMQEVALEKGINLRYAHVNCRLWKTEYIILLRIIRIFIPKFPKRGFNVPELWHTLCEEILSAKNIYLLLTLDNFEYLQSNYPQLLYNLSRICDDSLNSKQRISFIIIAPDDSFKTLLEPSISSTFQCSTVPFENYSNLQLDDILRARIKEAFFDGTVLEDTLRLISDFAAETGDCRYALELLWLAGKMADEVKAFQINAEYVRRAALNIHPRFKREIIQNLSFQNQILLLAICNYLKLTQKGYTTIGECEPVYRELCENLEVNPYRNTQLWVNIRLMVDTTDLISKEVSTLEGLGKRLNPSTIIRLNYPINVIKTVLEKEIDGVVDLAIKKRREPKKIERNKKKNENRW
ncbi:MAG: Cdc6/Cdc18 family protein [Promethearchaeota archaeon]